MAIGLHEHITYQDEWDYSEQDYQKLVLDVESREINPWRQVICLIIFNDNQRCRPGYTKGETE